MPNKYLTLRRDETGRWISDEKEPPPVIPKDMTAEDLQSCLVGAPYIVCIFE